MAILELRDVSFSYPNGFLAVDHVSIQVEKGESLAIIGQNGAGKTTTVKLCNNLHRPTSGDVLVNGENTKSHTTAEISRIVGYVFQNPDDQIFNATVESEVAYGPKMKKLPKEEVQRLVDEALEITGLSAVRDENPYNLPLSIRKFITIASIIAMQTEIIILDEPTAGQDLEGNRRLEKILHLLKEQGKTLITISHDMEFVASNFDRVIVMANKHVLADSTPEEVFWNFAVLSEAKLTQPYASRICHHLGINKKLLSRNDVVDVIMEEIQAANS